MSLPAHYPLIHVFQQKDVNPMLSFPFAWLMWIFFFHCMDQANLFGNCSRTKCLWWIYQPGLSQDWSDQIASPLPSCSNFLERSIFCCWSMKGEWWPAEESQVIWPSLGSSWPVHPSHPVYPARTTKLICDIHVAKGISQIRASISITLSLAFLSTESWTGKHDCSQFW